LKSFDQYLDQFFADHQQDLERFYPGLQLHFFKAFVFENLLTSSEDFFLQTRKHREFLSKLLKGVPLEYISGKRFFYRSSFCCNEKTLIPRFETETLVEMALKEIKGLKELSFIDIGCGTGIIGLSLLRELKNTKVRATLSDISAEALVLTKKNYHKLSYFFPPHDISFKLSDRLEKIEEHFDLILTNPPYIIKSEDELHRTVLHHEPELALFLDSEEYFPWFKEFFSQIAWHLKSGGVFLMEGSEKHLRQLLKEAESLQLFSKLEIRLDLTGRDRFLYGLK
jgi:release factor glutamine methyltransferase